MEKYLFYSLLIFMCDYCFAQHYFIMTTVVDQSWRFDIHLESVLKMIYNSLLMDLYTNLTRSLEMWSLENFIKMMKKKIKKFFFWKIAEFKNLFKQIILLDHDQDNSKPIWVKNAKTPISRFRVLPARYCRRDLYEYDL